MCRTSLPSVYVHTTGKTEGNRDLRSHPPVFLRDAPVVLLPPLVVITGGIGLFCTARTSSGLTVWRAYSHNSPRPQCSALWSPCLLRDAARELVVRFCVGAVLARLLSMSKPISAMYFINSRHSSLLSRGPLGCCWCPPSSQSACPPSLRAVSRGTGPHYALSSQGLGDALCQ